MTRPSGDWEAGDSYRKLLRKCGVADLREKLRERSYECKSAPHRTVHLFLASIAAHPRAFMLLGLIYPHRSVIAGVIQEGPFPVKGPHPTSCAAKPKPAAPLLLPNHYSA